MVVWSMWFSRNEARQGKARQQASAITEKARLLLEEFQRVNLKIPQSEAENEVHWVPPKAPWYKLNSDGATFAIIHAAGVGVVIRDSTSRVDSALSKKFPTLPGPLETKAKSLEGGVFFLLWISVISIREVILECDSKIVSKAVNGSNVPSVNWQHHRRDSSKIESLERYKYLMLNGKAIALLIYWLSMLRELLIM